MIDSSWRGIHSAEAAGSRAPAAREATPEPATPGRPRGLASLAVAGRRKSPRPDAAPTFRSVMWAAPSPAREPGPLPAGPVEGPTRAPAPGMVDAVTADLLSCVGMADTLGPLTTLHFDLEPRGMGPIQARFLQGTAGMEVHLVVVEPATRRELERYLPDLEARLTDAGVALRRLSVSRPGEDSSAREESAAGGGETRDDSAEHNSDRRVGGSGPEWRLPAP